MLRPPSQKSPRIQQLRSIAPFVRSNPGLRFVTRMVIRPILPPGCNDRFQRICGLRLPPHPQCELYYVPRDTLLVTTLRWRKTSNERWLSMLRALQEPTKRPPTHVRRPCTPPIRAFSACQGPTRQIYQNLSLCRRSRWRETPANR